MTMQFISHRFPDYHDPTIEDAYKTQVRIDDEPAYLDILDTAGQAEFTAMRDQYMRGGEGFIICYSITDRQSFQEAAEFKELIYRVRHTYDIPVVLVGNKIDLEEFRQVVFRSENSMSCDLKIFQIYSGQLTLDNGYKKHSGNGNLLKTNPEQNMT
ncbi:GTP-binding protein Rit2 [Pitangus sulphuratus]|nr:GTP-binding protein Rit2 [Pitangus sulphuratus]